MTKSSGFVNRSIARSLSLASLGNRIGRRGHPGLTVLTIYRLLAMKTFVTKVAISSPLLLSH